MADLSVDAAQLLASGITLQWPEALALVQALAANHTDDLASSRLVPDGRLIGQRPDGSATPASLAKLLQQLLPPPGVAVEPKVPAALRYTLLRALGSITAPPFASLEDFTGTLSRFEQGDRAGLLRGVFARWQSWEDARPKQAPARAATVTAQRQPESAPSTPSPAPRAPQPVTPPPAPLGPRAPQPDARIAVPPRREARSGDPAGQLLLHPEERFGPRQRIDRLPTPLQPMPPASAGSLRPREVVAAVGESRGPREAGRAGRSAIAPPGKRQPAGRLLTALAGASLVFAAGIVGIAVLLSDGSRRSPVFDALAPRLAEARDRVVTATNDIASSIRRTSDSSSPSKPDTNTGEGQASPAGSAGNGGDGSETGSNAGTTGTGGTGTSGSTTGGAKTPDGATPHAAGPNGAAPDAPSSAATTPSEPASEANTPGSMPGAGAPGASSKGSAEPVDPLDDANTPPRPGALVVGLDVGAKPVFSPSFASDGSALFFDQQTDKGGSALKEARTGGDKVLHVLSVLDDGARNYHPQLSPDGTTVAFDSDRDGVRGVYLSDRDGRNIRRVSGEGYAAVPKWSPDGRRLAFVKAEPGNARVWNVWTLDVGSGAIRRATSYRYGQPWGASWLPDGRRICYSHEDRILVLDTVSGAQRTYLSPKKGRLVRTPAVSPDGRRAIFQLYREGAWLLDLKDGSMDKVLDDPTAEEFAWSPDGTRVAFHSRRDRQWGIYVMGQQAP